MRRFSSYGPIDTDLYYYAPRKELIEKGYAQLTGEDPSKGGHYITVWAPRQTGKTWAMRELVEKIKKTTSFSCGIMSMELAKTSEDNKMTLEIFVEKLTQLFQVNFPKIEAISLIPSLFTKQYFKQPVILVIDEFDSLEENFINGIIGVFRDMFIGRANEADKVTGEKTYLLHGLALIGVRSVLGIENVKGSPFNVQRSLHIPNLTYDEVKGMFDWYEKESGQKIEKDVIDRLYDETRGQPGLTCWFGELLTEGFEGYNIDKSKPIAMKDFDAAYGAAISILPNNNILNIISKAKIEPYRQMILELFKTDRKVEFKYDDPMTNYLYMNGIIDREKESNNQYYIKYSCPFVQKRLFNYFSNELFRYMGKLYEPVENLKSIITGTHIDIKNLAGLYQRYLNKNKEWLLKGVPRRTDNRIYEAVYHFNFYSYLYYFLRDFEGRVFPEFPTGNGKIDLLITFRNNRYGIELKSFTNEWIYEQSLEKAAKYGKQLGLTEIYLVFFIEYIDDNFRKAYEKDFPEPGTGVLVKSILIETGI